MVIVGFVFSILFFLLSLYFCNEFNSLPSRRSSALLKWTKIYFEIIYLISAELVWLGHQRHVTKGLRVLTLGCHQIRFFSPLIHTFVQINNPAINWSYREQLIKVQDRGPERYLTLTEAQYTWQGPTSLVLAHSIVTKPNLNSFFDSFLLLYFFYLFKVKILK